MKNKLLKLCALLMLGIGLTEIHAQKINTFTDSRDGNVYKTVKIGNQVWMAENLKYLPKVVGSGTGSDTIPYYYVYGYNGINVSEAKKTENYATYGVLYNWPAAMSGFASSTANPSGIKGVCPKGWHLPSEAEWDQLSDFLGGHRTAGYKLKEVGTKHWSNSEDEAPNDASNETGFRALPGGSRNDKGAFYGIGKEGNWWSATESSTGIVKYWLMYSKADFLGSSLMFRKYGFCVRCLKD